MILAGFWKHGRLMRFQARALVCPDATGRVAVPPGSPHTLDLPEWFLLALGVLFTYRR